MTFAVSLSRRTMEPTRCTDALSILVADDDADMRLYLTGCLRGMGTRRIFETADGREALHLARVLLPDLVISDIVMAGLDGAALCTALKADAQTAAIPLLLVSGEVRAPLPCCDGFLKKPFNASQLRAVVTPLLNIPR